MGRGTRMTLAPLGRCPTRTASRFARVVEQPQRYAFALQLCLLRQRDIESAPTSGNSTNEMGDGGGTPSQLGIGMELGLCGYLSDLAFDANPVL